MTRMTLAAVVIGSVVLASCGAPPRPWLRFAQEGPTNWTAGEAGTFVGRLHGADVVVDLGQKDTKVLVRVENRSRNAVEFRMGPEGGAPREAIGQVLLRPLSGPPGPGADYVHYVSMQPMKVDADWRGEFHLDSPLGRDPQLGTYFVLTVEARDAAGTVERRTLPLAAVNSGTKTN
jgi:hypothetical protein